MADLLKRPVIPVDFDDDAVLAAAWYYYEDRLKQGEVAELLGVSRATVVNHLQEARARGIVQTTLAPAYRKPVGLARKVVARYGLAGALVIPDGPPGVEPAARIGAAGARALLGLVRPGSTLGVAWGRTVLALSNALPAAPVRDLSVAQITGSMLATYAFSPELCTTNIASRLGGRCINLHAPGLVSHPRVKSMLMREPTLLQHFEIIRASDALVFGVASASPEMVDFVLGRAAAAESPSLVPATATAIIAGRFIDGDGNAVSGSLDTRMIGLTLDEIRAIPERLCVAGGPGKVDALRAALAGGFATIFVTDESTARAIVAAG